MESNSTAFLIKIKLRHSLGGPSRSDFVQLYVADQKSCAEEIVKRCRENSFKSIRFSYDQAIPNALYVTVYGSKHQVEEGKEMFSFSYLQEDTSGTYNIIDNPEKFILKLERADEL